MQLLVQFNGGRATLTCNQYPSSHKCHSPDLRSRSPDLRSRSQELHSRSLDLRSRSRDHSHNPAEDSPGSWRKLCAGLQMSTCGRASVLMRGPWQTASSTTRCWSKTAPRGPDGQPRTAGKPALPSNRRGGPAAPRSAAAPRSKAQGERMYPAPAAATFGGPGRWGCTSHSPTVAS
ncbi:uncharacterized protein LOC119389106 [Rhipicephalus sanguineus]|uniref:uncharacterized protein LOC119389106 n=1 Tax=Rhipicephalus sanguineus TaxID=34632 RepID=UPI0020C2691C|nr:uncharacterized protein LOC119389106 [Rhipicephalus sanguineus]